MGFQERRDSFISATSSDYSQSTRNEQDDGITIKDPRDSHVTPPDKRPEASEIPPEEAHSSPESEADTEDSLSVKLAKIKTKVKKLFDEADKALSEASLPHGDLEILADIEKDRDHLFTRKEHHKKRASTLKGENDALMEQLSASQKKAARSEARTNELIANAKKLFA